MDTVQIIKKVKDIFKEKKYTGYDESENQSFYVLKKENFELRDGSIKDIYLVSFSSKPIFGERKALDAFVDSETFEIYYIMGPSSYIEI